LVRFMFSLVLWLAFSFFYGILFVCDARDETQGLMHTFLWMTLPRRYISVLWWYFWLTEVLHFNVIHLMSFNLFISSLFLIYLTGSTRTMLKQKQWQQTSCLVLNSQRKAYTISPLYIMFDIWDQDFWAGLFCRDTNSARMRWHLAMCVNTSN
jgi:hypothetical protein